MKDNTLRESNTRVKDMVNELETITYYKHHYVRKTGLKKAIKALLAEEVRKARIDELKRLREVTGLKTPPVSRYHDGYHDAMAVIYHTNNTRIKQLEKDK